MFQNGQQKQTVKKAVTTEKSYLISNAIQMFKISNQLNWLSLFLLM